MTAPLATPDKSKIARALELLQAAGHTLIEPPVLQPADVFLDLIGEDIRRRLFQTNGPDGADLCLRPDFTIPVCRQHLASGGTAPADYFYHGLVFRQRTDTTGEIPQIGAESLGRADLDGADADMLALSSSVLKCFGVDTQTIRIGDETLFAAVLSGLDLPAAWQRRLRGLFGEGEKLSDAIARMAGSDRNPDDNRDVRFGFLSALEGVAPDAAHAVVEDLLSIAGISAVGGRTPSEIADRFLEQAALATGNGGNERAAGILSRYLAISGPADKAATELETFAAETGIDLAAPLATFKARLSALEARGHSASSLHFAADFGRRLDYYSGFVFEIHGEDGHEDGQLVGGGRYDRLVTLLGAESDVPSIGFSIWLDRIAKLSGASA
ncbi:ATP phosphoribosyltransferase regulatory subunit [Roseibium sp.]|uniref:ATP phosphoribosyltransferase regulatory subunit n=1 Tax=Roseibium sp. TaxID=1936156 RepID=UPI003A97963C